MKPLPEIELFYNSTCVDGSGPVKRSKCAVSLHPDRGRRCRRQPEDRVFGLECPCSRTSWSAESGFCHTDPGMCSFCLLGWPTRSLCQQRQASVDSSWTPAGSEELQVGENQTSTAEPRRLQAGTGAADLGKGNRPRPLRVPSVLHQGELTPGVEVFRAGSQSLDALITATIISSGTLRVFWRLPVLPWCTQLPEDPANLLHNGEQVGTDPWCNVTSSDYPDYV